MLHQQLRDEWLARLRNVPIDPAPRFAEQGIVLGVGTVLLACDGGRRLQQVKGQETRLLALLSAAFGKVLPHSVVGNIARAATSWSRGDDCLAYAHLAHARLPAPHDLHASACRLLVAEKAMTAGVAPQIILQALRACNAGLDSVEKFDPSEPRVPAGSGKPSGEWTRDEGAAKPSPLSYLMPGAASWLSELAPSAATSLGEYALNLMLGAGGAVAAFGLLFIPSRNNTQINGEVEGIPGLRYSWNRDEAVLRFTYESPDGEPRTFTAHLDEDVFRDGQGRVVGRLLPGGAIAVDPAAISPDLAQDDEPRLCPAPGPDKPNQSGRDYENYVKTFVNPEPNTTPSGIGFQLPNPENSGKLVFYDDCQQSTGTMVDAKGPGYAGLLTYPITMQSVVYEWLDEASRQIAASGGRPVRWYFAEAAAADFARELFSYYDEGLERIDVELLPWTGKRQ